MLCSTPLHLHANLIQDKIYRYAQNNKIKHQWNREFQQCALWLDNKAHYVMSVRVNGPTPSGWVTPTGRSRAGRRWGANSSGRWFFFFYLNCQS